MAGLVSVISVTRTPVSAVPFRRMPNGGDSTTSTTGPVDLGGIGGAAESAIARVQRAGRQDSGYL